MAILADLLSLVKDGAGGSVAGAVHGGLLEIRYLAVERDIPRPSKVLAARTVAEGIGAGVGHADDAAGLIHALGRCERLDKADLLFSRPAVVAAAELGRLERDRRRRDALGRGNGLVRGH